MSQFDIPIRMPGGFKSLEAAKAHREIVGKLVEKRAMAAEAAEDLKSIDKVEIDSTPSDLYTDLAPGKGHVILLSQPEGQPLLGAELNYDPNTGETRRLVIDLDSRKLTQAGESFKLEQNGEGGSSTTYFRFDDRRGVVSVVDPERQVPAIFGDADPKELTAKTLQASQPILLF